MNFALELAQIHIQKRTGQGCVQSNGFCPSWIADNFNRYVDPFWEHVALVLESVVIGFVIAFGLALLAHRRRGFETPITVSTGVLYTIPSLALFQILVGFSFLGLNRLTVEIALVSYTLLILFRNTLEGLRGVPADVREAAVGMGLTRRQVLTRVELPLALPAIVAHRRRWLTGPIVGITGALYTVPSIAAFILLLPLTGRGNTTALIALVSYTLLVLFRNITTGLRNVPPEMVDAGRGMGLTANQILRKVELPLAVPEILAGLRIAVTTNVGLATLAFFAGAGGLGKEIYADVSFKSNVVVAGGLAVLLAAVLDVIILTFQRLVTPWRRARAT